MKRILCIVGFLSLCAMPLCAQTTQAEEREFRPYWQMQLQGGVGYTIGEADFDQLLSPAAALSAGYKFTPVWGLRVGVSGWQGKGAWLTPSQVYKFNFLQVNADVMVDLANWIGGYKYDRLVNPYVFLGVGGNFAFNNGEAKAVNDAGYKLSLLWSGCQPFVAGRAGAGVDFRLSERVSLGLEMNTNMLPDKFNAKKAGNVDWQINTLAGLTFRFNKGRKNVSAPVPYVAAPMPIVVEQAVEPLAESVVEVPAPVAVLPEPEVIAAPVEAVVEAPVVVQSSAPAPPSPDSYKMRQDIFFAINAFALRASENAKIAALVESLKANPGAQVSVVGYADAPTGNSQGNYWLSGWRAISVRDALKAKGIDTFRIKMNFKGDKEQPYSDVEDNRVVICIVR